MKNKVLANLDKEQLLQLIDIYAKDWLALDGVWFQSIEDKFGMDEAMCHDENAWRNYTVIEAKRIKDFLRLPIQAGIDGLKQALSFRIYSNINDYEIIIEDNVLIFRTLECRVQNARKRKGLEYHPCRRVGLIEYKYFAKTIDDRFACEPISCYPQITDETCSCSWKFTLDQ
jgi:hypothetical protein